MVDQETGIDFPFYQRNLMQMFGNPARSSFADDYLYVMDFGEFGDAFAHVNDFRGQDWSCRIYGNYVLEGPLYKAFSLIVERGLAHELKTFDGCWNVRKMKGGRSYSVHSWGLAIDLNAATNPFTRGELITDLSTEFVSCFLETGFEWGGMWNSIKDAMHFQLPWTRRWRPQPGKLCPQPFVRKKAA